jgi:hypothetical protein
MKNILDFCRDLPQKGAEVMGGSVHEVWRPFIYLSGIPVFGAGAR